MNDKITVRHLERAAYVYIRQSTLQQVRNNLESNRRQYALQARARELGFAQVIVIDEDLGVSGTGSKERPGFGRLLAAVCDGQVGAVFALEASRLARNNRDWHHLIDLCVLTDTVVVDAEGIYDPRRLNDRLLLGLKGTMSEFEIGLLRQRAMESYRQKVFRGEVLTRVPIGYVRVAESGIAITPDREVQEAIRGVFLHFERLGSLRQVMLWYHRENLRLPIVPNRTGQRLPVWQLPNYAQLCRIVKNPVYAGAFAWGRTHTQTQVEDGRSRKRSGRRVAMGQWQVLLRDHHPAYISWERYLENQRILNSNQTKSHPTSTGAPKCGSALLAGLLRCARCGQKLVVAYRGRDGRAPRYYCHAGKRELSQAGCLAFGGVKVQRAVIEAVLEACQPIGVEAALRVLNGTQEERKQKRRLLELALERARYQATLAQRQYDAVDATNRLVAAELEARWNTSLAQVSEAEANLQKEQNTDTSLNDDQRQRVLRLGADLHALWEEPSAPVELKKRILRTVIQEIVVGVAPDPNTIELKIHWMGGVHTTLRASKNKYGRTAQATDEKIIEVIRELAKARPDPYIATLLNRLGYRTGPGNTWTEVRVRHLRNYHQIPVFERSEKPAWISAEEAAKRVNVGVAVIRSAIRHQILPARQIAKGVPWMIQIENLHRPEVQSYIKQARAGVRGRLKPAR
jgi:DNA invertase Pin-like site-specific DNA recombinase